MGAAGGALVSVGCGPAGIICLPVMVVAGAVEYGEKGARGGGNLFRNAAAPQSQGSAPKPAAPTGVVELGPILGSDISPAGILSLDLRSVRPLDGGGRNAMLVVNFERQTQEGEMSYMAEVSVACASGALTLNSWYSFETLDTGGRLIRRSPSSQTVTNERPGPPLDAAIRAICSH